MKFFLLTLGSFIAFVGAKIHIVHPTALKKEAGDEEGLIEAGLANFGHIDYGTSILGQVFVPLENENGCKPFTQQMFAEDAQTAWFHNKISLELPVILLTRGGCTFVTKVRNVEKAGANLALIGDNKVENSEVFIMSDDGSGHSINIPSFFIRKETADAFRASSQKGEQIILQISIETEKSDDQAQVDLWVSTPFDLSLKTIDSLRRFIPVFSQQIDFNIRVRSKACFNCGLEEVEKECLSNGEFCALPPTTKDEDIEGFVDTIGGQSLLLETLITKCVNEVVQEQHPETALVTIFDYMYNFRANCTSDLDKVRKTDCAFDQMQELGIDQAKVEQCWTSSFVESGNTLTGNFMLDDDSMMQIDLGVYMHPSLTINSMTYRGYLEGKDVFEAICSSFVKMPIMCQDPNQELDFSSDSFNDITDDKEDATKVRKVIVWGILGFLLLGQIIFFVWYRRVKQRQMSGQMRNTVDNAVVEYMRVNNQTTENAQGDTQSEQPSESVDAKNEL